MRNHIVSRNYVNFPLSVCKEQRLSLTSDDDLLKRKEKEESGNYINDWIATMERKKEQWLFISQDTVTASVTRTLGTRQLFVSSDLDICHPLLIMATLVTVSSKSGLLYCHLLPLKDSFTLYRIPGFDSGFVFLFVCLFFSTLMLSFHCLLTCVVSNEKSVIILIVDTSFLKKSLFNLCLTWIISINLCSSSLTFSFEVSNCC